MLAGLLLLVAAQDGCLTSLIDPAEQPEPMQAAGDGLWIGGIAFLSTDFTSVAAVEDDYGLSWSAQIRFSPSGNAKFIAAQRCGVGRAIEISIDRKAISRPNLNEPITGGEAQISAGWTRAEAEAMVRRLSGG